LERKEIYERLINTIKNCTLERKKINVRFRSDDFGIGAVPTTSLTFYLWDDLHLTPQTLSYLESFERNYRHGFSSLIVRPVRERFTGKSLYLVLDGRKRLLVALRKRYAYMICVILNEPFVLSSPPFPYLIKSWFSPEDIGKRKPLIRPEMFEELVRVKARHNFSRPFTTSEKITLFRAGFKYGLSVGDLYQLFCVDTQLFTRREFERYKSIFKLPGVIISEIVKYDLTTRQLDELIKLKQDPDEAIKLWDEMKKEL
jgi:hypothetical protein